MIDDKKVGKFIAELRREKNMTQDDLALKLTVDRTIISKWERGLYLPNIEFLLKMQDIFNVTINEILFGERKNDENNEKIDTIPVDIINKSKKIVKRYVISFFIIINSVIILFLSFYFINNYNSIKVYTISGEDSNFGIYNGVMIYSKEKSYIKLGKIYNYSNKKIINIELCYKKNNKETIIYSGLEDNSDYLIVNRFNYNELYKYEDIPLILNGLYIKITLEDGDIEYLKLNLKRDFSNNKFITRNIFSISDANVENLNIEYNISDNILKEYVYSVDEGCYYNFFYENDVSYLVKYYNNLSKLVVLKTYNNESEYYDIDLIGNTVNYSYLIDGNLINYFDYDLNNDECIYGECNIEEFNIIKNKYLKDIISN